MAASTTTRAESVAQALREAIRRGDYLSGERLVELSLAMQMNVSQNTVRDALRILEGEGWVVKHPRRGSHVRAFTAEEAQELYALWSTVECLALRWVMDSLNKNTLNQLRRLLRQAHQYALTGHVWGAVEALFALHRALSEASGKHETALLLENLHNRVYLLEILRHQRAPRSPRIQETEIILYEKLISIIEKGDKNAAQNLLEFLIMDSCMTLLPLLASNP
jgi:DNA-binding GntR family transcriptional regulator